MSITLPSPFEARKYLGGVDASVIVAITNNAGTSYYFSEKPMVVSSGDNVLGHLYDISPVTHGYDYYTCEYQPAHVTISIANLWSRRTAAGVWHRASDFMPDGSVNGLWGQRLRVYVHPGSGLSLVSGSLLVFDGSITGMTMQGEDRLTIQADEVWDSYFAFQVPQTKATRTTYTDLPIENVGKPLPIVYGPHNEQTYLRNTGFALGLRIAEWKWIIAGHIIDSFYDEPRPSANTDGTSYGSSSTKAIWIYFDELASWGRSYAGVTFDTDDSGVATVLVDPAALGVDVYLYPGSGESASTAVDSGNTAGITSAFDYDTSTKYSIIANSTTAASCYFEWYQKGSDSTDPQENGIADLVGPGTVLDGVNLYMSKPGGTTISSSSIEVWNGASWTTVATSIDVATANMIHYTFTGSFDWNSNLQWHLGSGATTGDGTPFKVRLSFVGSGWTANSTVVAYVHEIRLVKSCGLPKTIITVGSNPDQAKRAQPGWIKWYDYGWAVDYLDPSKLKYQGVLGASVTGREYGSWISDHSAAPDAAGDQISTAPGIIESLLCDEIGVTTGSINMDSFDAVYNASDDRGAVVSLVPGSITNMRSLVKQLCFEHRLVLYRGRGSAVKFTLVDARGRSSSAGTILPGDLAAMPEVGMTPFNPSNLITFWYRKLPHDGQYFKSETVEDTTSSGEYGDFAEDIYLETIKNTAFMDPLRDHLISTPGYLASRARYLVTFRTKGLRWHELELGDVIQFDNDLDSQMLCFGETWGSRDFVIYEASVLRDTTVGMEFRAISVAPADL